MNIIDNIVRDRSYSIRQAEKILTKTLGQQIHIGYTYDPVMGELIEVRDRDYNLIREVYGENGNLHQR